MTDYTRRDWAIMDNRQVRVVAETKHELTAAVVLAMGDQKGLAFVEHDDGLAVFWYTQGGTDATAFLYPHTPEQVAEVAWNWLEANRDKRRGDYDGGDVKNVDGFQLTQDSWGHAHNPDEDLSWRNGSFFLRPVAAWVGK